MALAAGTRLGPYELRDLIGAGGMGEVYRAHDPRIRRDVAIKILPSSYAADAERLERFRREARAAGGLNHPNILIVHDVGTDPDLPYIVSELLDGESLRQVIQRGPVPVKRALEWGAQLARALAAAHERGIVHRDLKPENVFVTRDGRLKVLDFGIAGVVTLSDESAATRLETIVTSPGALVGTVGYMAPEQIAGAQPDARSDVFALGVVLHEMLTGRQPFARPTTVETLAASLASDPPPLDPAVAAPAVARIVRRMMARDPTERFQSARDVAFVLEEVDVALPAPVPPGQRRRRTTWLLVAALCLAALTAAIGLFLPRGSPFPTYRPLTARRGTVWSARFAPDGQTIAYSASWDGEPVELFSSRIGSLQARSLGFAPAALVSMSRSGEMALLLNPRWILTHLRVGTLARADLAGGAPREVASGVHGADWSPDGRELAIVRAVDGENRLEFPIGRVLYATHGATLHSPRVSPDGQRVALFERSSDTTRVITVSTTGERRVLSDGWDITSRGLAWRPDGDEVWFTAGQTRALGLHAASVRRGERVLLKLPKGLELFDVASDGRVLVGHMVQHQLMYSRRFGASTDQIISSMDLNSFLHDISNNGSVVLYRDFDGLRLKQSDDSPPVLLAHEDRWIPWSALAPDGMAVLVVLPPSPEAVLTLVPTGPGETRLFPELGNVTWADWLPDSRRFLFARNRRDGITIGVFDLASNRHREIRNTDESLPSGVDPAVAADSFRLCSDGRRVAIQSSRGIQIHAIDHGAVVAVPGSNAGHTMIGWAGDGQAIYVYRIGDVPVVVSRLEIETGVVRPFMTLGPIDRAGLWRIHPVRVTPDGRSHTYSSSHLLSDLYLIEGLR